eukprot:1440732-Rhodomonas_salina.1
MQRGEALKAAVEAVAATKKLEKGVSASRVLVFFLQSVTSSQALLPLERSEVRLLSPWSGQKLGF